VTRVVDTIKCSNSFFMHFSAIVGPENLICCLRSVPHGGLQLKDEAQLQR
jgi:hypothetical protein